MRRALGVLLISVAAAAFVPACANAAALAPPPDLRVAVMQRVFGETGDSRASIAASYGDRSGESLLRELALGFAMPRTSAASPPAAQSAGARLAAAPFVPSVRPALEDSLPANAASRAVAQEYAVGAYQPSVQPVTTPDTDSPAFDWLSRAQDGRAASLAVASNDAVSSRATNARVLPQVQVGRVGFQGRTEGATAVSPLSLREAGYGAGASFQLRAGRQRVNVDLSSSYEHLTSNDAALSSPAGGNSAWLLPGADAPVIPNNADMSKVSVGAAVAVPVTHALTLAVGYDAQRMIGGYGLPGLANLDASGNSYGGKLVFAIPNSSSTLSISARQYRYQDNVIPTNTLTQTREDVNFTVKF